jgi:hypothetical protein
MAFQDSDPFPVVPSATSLVHRAIDGSRINTEGDAFERPPLSVALLMVYRNYFFFAAFLAGAFLAAAFFAGAFLAAFFVAIFPILPFRWFASMSAIFKLQLNECIDSSHAIVKKKTYKEWKNGQQFSRDA